MLDPSPYERLLTKRSKKIRSGQNVIYRNYLCMSLLIEVKELPLLCMGTTLAPVHETAGTSSVVSLDAMLCSFSVWSSNPCSLKSDLISLSR